MKFIKFIDENGNENIGEILFQTNIEDRNYAICKANLNNECDEIVAFNVVENSSGNLECLPIMNELDKEKINNLILAIIKEGML